MRKNLTATTLYRTGFVMNDWSIFSIFKQPKFFYFLTGVEKRDLDWTKFVHGQILDLQATELDHMAYTDFYHLSSSVTTLLLNDNKLTQVIYELPVLLSFVTYMNLENNCLIDLPAEFGMMERLKFLNISGNQVHIGIISRL